MKTTRVHPSIAAFASAIVLLFQMSPALAGAAPVAAGDNDRDVEITFTKFITDFSAFPEFLPLGGVVGGDLGIGTFGGHSLVESIAGGRVFKLEATYVINAGDQSFTAEIHGTQVNHANRAVLNGVIIDGWRAGARVHVAYDVISCPRALQPPSGSPCFQGTISVRGSSK